MRRGAGYETIMMNSNPETVSTDYDTSSRLYFEPLTIEDVLNVLDAERPDGIIVQFGGQTPLKLAAGLQAALREAPIPAASGAPRAHAPLPRPSAHGAACERALSHGASGCAPAAAACRLRRAVLTGDVRQLR